MSLVDLITVGANVFASLGTVGAFGTGMVLLQREHKREELRSEEARRDQAVKVSAWIEAQRTPSGGRELLFLVHNASDMPIYEVTLSNPDHDDTESDEAEFIGLVPPGQTARRPAPSAWLSSYFAAEPIEVEFLDSRGRRWKRDEQGRLALQAQ